MQHLKKQKARNYPGAVRRLVANHFGYDIKEVYIVWFSHIVGNFKALASTTKKDKRYFEVTYDSLHRRIIIEEYRRVNRFVLRKP